MMTIARTILTDDGKHFVRFLFVYYKPQAPRTTNHGSARDLFLLGIDHAFRF
jgi:hypothetical protein